MSLDDIHKIMSWPIGELDPFRLSVRMQVDACRLRNRRHGAARWLARPRSCPLVQRDAVLDDFERRLRERAGITADSLYGETAPRLHACVAAYRVSRSTTRRPAWRAPTRMLGRIVVGSELAEGDPPPSK
jgi:hypothetical protein